MLRAATLASGSSGNCTVVSDGNIHILIDAGISAKRIADGLAELGLSAAELTAILITHEHSDHISGLPVLCKRTQAEIYATEPTARQICGRTTELRERFRVFDPGERFALGDLVVGSFAVSHDCACPVGYTVSDGTRKLALCTDTGVVNRAMLGTIEGANTLIGEFNYDPDMLRKGPYPPQLKARILGEHGHLSNEMGGKLAVWAADHGTDRVVLAHLSKENNLPAVALAAAKKALGHRSGIQLVVAPRNDGSGWLEV